MFLKKLFAVALRMASRISNATRCWWIAGNCTIIRMHLPFCWMKVDCHESTCLALERPRPAKSPAGVDARFREGAPSGRTNRHDFRCAQIRQDCCQREQSGTDHGLLKPLSCV